MLHIGFTGTRHGMTEAQKLALREITADDAIAHDYWAIHHGDCVGADAEFHAYMTSASDPQCIRIIHPGPIGENSAGCEIDERRDERRSPAPHMQRNRCIVAQSAIMIAAPYEMEPQKRGGTWATIGFAKKAGKPLAILWPDGTITRERWP